MRQRDARARAAASPEQPRRRGDPDVVVRGRRGERAGTIPAARRADGRAAPGQTLVGERVLRLDVSGSSSGSPASRNASSASTLVACARADRSNGSDSKRAQRASSRPDSSNVTTVLPRNAKIVCAPPPAR
jgi:hypothetical protein